MMGIARDSGRARVEQMLSLSSRPPVGRLDVELACPVRIDHDCVRVLC